MLAVNQRLNLGSLLTVVLACCLVVTSGCYASEVDATNSTSQDKTEKSNKEKPSDKDKDKAETKNSAQGFDIDKDPARPFKTRIRMPEFPKDTEWLNTAGPLRMRDLKGKFVIFDFWTYCCINCIHVLPVLKKIERKYPNEVVVIGVHSAKFETEKGSENITNAILRYEIEHPVINDAEHRIWDTFQIRSWPTMLLIDPTGHAVWMKPGETKFETLDEVLTKGIKYYREKKLLDDTPVRIEIALRKQKATPLRFPGKILADAENKRLFIADSNHNRIVICGVDGKLQEIIGAGTIGRKDGDYASAQFDHPQGMALHKNVLYVADTENHMLRKIDLAGKTVKTIAGTGVQSKSGFPGLDKLKSGDAFPDRWIGKPRETELNSPWALYVRNDELYIAMAGPHQIWKMPLNEKEIGPYAGNGREDIVDGELLPSRPYSLGFSSFAQPSGLTADEDWLYVADSEGSSIRAVPFDPKQEVKTVVGTAKLPFNRLFSFGDVDGKKADVKLQHALGVVYKKGKIYITDTYNHKIKVVDAETGETKTLAGTGKAGASDADGTFSEPAGITLMGNTLYVADTNNHLIRSVDIDSGKVKTIQIAGLVPPKKIKKLKPSFDKAITKTLPEAALTLKDGKASVNVKLELEIGWKVNKIAPMQFCVSNSENSKVISDETAGNVVTIEKPSKSLSFDLPLLKDAKGTLEIAGIIYYCQLGGEGICKAKSYRWKVPIKIAEGSSNTIELKQTVK